MINKTNWYFYQCKFSLCQILIFGYFIKSNQLSEYLKITDPGSMSGFLMESCCRNVNIWERPVPILLRQGMTQLRLLDASEAGAAALFPPQSPVSSLTIWLCSSLTSTNICAARCNHLSGGEGPLRGPVLHSFGTANPFHWSAFRADSGPRTSTIAAGVTKVHLLSVQKAHCPTREIQKAINAAPE